MSPELQSPVLMLCLSCRALPMYDKQCFADVSIRVPLYIEKISFCSSLAKEFGLLDASIVVSSCLATCTNVSFQNRAVSDCRSEATRRGASHAYFRHPKRSCPATSKLLSTQSSQRVHSPTGFSKVLSEAKDPLSIRARYNGRPRSLSVPAKSMCPFLNVALQDLAPEPGFSPSGDLLYFVDHEYSGCFCILLSQRETNGVPLLI